VQFLRATRPAGVALVFNIMLRQLSCAVRYLAARRTKKNKAVRDQKRKQIQGRHCQAIWAETRPQWGLLDHLTRLTRADIFHQVVGANLENFFHLPHALLPHPSGE
jgi:hypothetical protein